MYINLRTSKIDLNKSSSTTLNIKGVYPVGHRNHIFEIEFNGDTVRIIQGDLLEGKENAIKKELIKIIGKGPFGNLKNIEIKLIENEIVFKY